MKKIDKAKIKTWFVTGASSGIGKELCIQLLNRGYNVIAVARRQPNFNNVNALNLSVDVTDTNSVEKAVKKGIEHFGSINVLANIAGISSYKTFEEEQPEKVRQVMETNFWGTYNTCHSLIKYFRENNNGTIINCSSVMGLVPRVCGTAYCSSKHAIEGLTSVLWLETKNIDCRVMSIEPGLFPSNISKNEKDMFKSKYEEYQFPYTNIIKIVRDYRNDTATAMNLLIDIVEKEKMPRRLLLGKDCIQRVKYEIKTIKDNIKTSNSISKKIAIGKKDKRYKEFEICDYMIVNFYNTVNYGASLTAWAMQELIKSFGFTCLLLNHNDFWNPDLYNSSFSRRFADNFLDLSQIYNNNELNKLSKNLKGVILGSDQVLRLDYINHNLYKYLLNWVDKNTKKIALSASFGINQEEFKNVKALTAKIEKYMKNAINSFDYLSCREISGQDIYKNVFGLESDVIIDPVFLINKSKYNEITSLSTINNKDKIISYILDDNEKYQNLYKFLSDKEKIECISINNKDYNVEDWLNSIKECRFLVTDSFHGVCFALIFGKPFVCIRNKKRGNTRFDSLIELFNIEKNFVYSIDEILNKKDFDYNIDYVNNRINTIKTDNLETIKSILSSNYSNNPNANKNKNKNNAYLKRLILINYFQYLRCKILYLFCSKEKKEHYKSKKNYFKKLFKL
ncbi:MAG: SDR family NAD(P)-dependent oxidoreductase [Candidatus Gastranaerophilales bacterium]|nr:SDR family NAD(P)-dependent oxidoreductase [Candidatus Gastranaerophilales bacterium]